MKRRIVAIAMIMAALALAAGAQDAEKPIWVGGIVKSVADGGDSFVVEAQKPKELGEIQCKLDPGLNKFYLYMPGTTEDLKDGQDVKAYGKVAEDGSAIDEATSIVVQTFESKGGNPTRMDGKLRIKDGAFYVEGSKGLAKINPIEKGLTVQVTADCDKTEIKEGAKISFSAVKQDDHYNAVKEMRFSVKRR